jgi:hypothetical protein
MEALKLLEQELKISQDKFYIYSQKVREGDKKSKEHRDFYSNSEIVISRLIELLKKGEGDNE